MSRVLIAKVVTLILIMLSGLILIVSTPNTSSADHSSSRATPTPVPTYSVRESHRRKYIHN